jgi:hypothetical protein
MSSAVINYPKKTVELLKRGAIAVKEGVKRILGPLLTTEFWAKTMALCAQEMIAAFMMALGGRFLEQGRARKVPELDKNRQSPAGTAFNYGPTAQRPEFSNGYGNYVPPTRPASAFGF